MLNMWFRGCTYRCDLCLLTFHFLIIYICYRLVLARLFKLLGPIEPRSSQLPFFTVFAAKLPWINIRFVHME